LALKKKERRKKRQDKNTMACPITSAAINIKANFIYLFKKEEKGPERH